VIQTTPNHRFACVQVEIDVDTKSLNSDTASENASEIENKRMSPSPNTTPETGISHPALPPGATAKLMVGMEIHVELATHSKMWTSAPNVAHSDNFSAEPNTLLDPVVIGMPGTLPVMNKTALEMSMLVGLALNCEIARFSKWDRKSYYYPDLPKNYQISQYDEPICGPGYLDIPSNGTDTNPNADSANSKRIRILRAHLEEDAGKLAHEAPGGGAIDYSIVDLNRAGTPLLEIVTEPDFTSADDAVTFGQALRNICRALNVTEGIMQKGHMRFEPNINVIIEHNGETYKTPIVEIKNLNSFKAVHGAIDYEYDRQIEAWAKDKKVMSKGSKSTHGWDDNRMATFLQREKEDEDDYRYFPDPDLVPVVVSEEWINEIQGKLPELPVAKRIRYQAELGLDHKDAVQLIDEPGTAAYFDEIIELGANAKKLAKLLLNAAAKHANDRNVLIHQTGVTPQQIADSLALVADGKISSNGADELLGHCCDSNASAESLAAQHGLLQVSDTGALGGFIDEVLANPKNEKAIIDIKAGKGKAIGALMGQVMKLSKGQANPGVVQKMIKDKLGE
jgi:aspartyl-tRNA(Asn)/glutamyl-tRNA(Gln) amidotransferase subunit B